MQWRARKLTRWKPEGKREKPSCLTGSGPDESAATALSFAQPAATGRFAREQVQSHWPPTRDAKQGRAGRMIPEPPAATPLEVRVKVDAARRKWAFALDWLPPDPVRVIEETRARPPEAAWSNVTEAPDGALLKPSDGARLIPPGWS